MMVYESTHRSKLFKFKFLGSSVAGGVCERRCRLQPMVCILMCVFTCIRIHSNSLRLNKVKKNKAKIEETSPWGGLEYAEVRHLVYSYANLSYAKAHT